MKILRTLLSMIFLLLGVSLLFLLIAHGLGNSTAIGNFFFGSYSYLSYVIPIFYLWIFFILLDSRYDPIRFIWPVATFVPFYIFTKGLQIQLWDTANGIDMPLSSLISMIGANATILTVYAAGTLILLGEVLVYLFIRQNANNKIEEVVANTEQEEEGGYSSINTLNNYPISTIPQSSAYQVSMPVASKQYMPQPTAISNPQQPEKNIEKKLDTYLLILNKKKRARKQVQKHSLVNISDKKQQDVLHKEAQTKVALTTTSASTNGFDERIYGKKSNIKHEINESITIPTAHASTLDVKDTKPIHTAARVTQNHLLEDSIHRLQQVLSENTLQDVQTNEVALLEKEQPVNYGSVSYANSIEDSSILEDLQPVLDEFNATVETKYSDERTEYFSKDEVFDNSEEEIETLSEAGIYDEIGEVFTEGNIVYEEKVETLSKAGVNEEDEMLAEDDISYEDEIEAFSEVGVYDEVSEEDEMLTEEDISYEEEIEALSETGAYDEVSEEDEMLAEEDVFYEEEIETLSEAEVFDEEAQAYEDPLDEFIEPLSNEYDIKNLANSYENHSTQVEAEVIKKPRGAYKIPIFGILDPPIDQQHVDIKLNESVARLLEITLQEFNIDAKVLSIFQGPVVTMFEILPAPGVRLSKIESLTDNIALRLAAQSIRIIAPIPGKEAVGIEVPNKSREIVSFAELITDKEFQKKEIALPIALGKNITDKIQIVDLSRTPHLLIAGATGSGKSVCVNSIICSILYRCNPDEVKLILIDPKIVELSFYNGIAHLLTPVISDANKSLQALRWCVLEMERRYRLLEALNVREIRNYNKKLSEQGVPKPQQMPFIVLVIDEFADLMMTCGKEIESLVSRLTAKSRAIGIHIVVATQRPSTDVITGLIKSNIPTRISFMVTSKTDSRIILDMNGAETLLGRGDMLYSSASDPFPERLQGPYLSEDEVQKIVEYVKDIAGPPEYISEEIFVQENGAQDSNESIAADPLWEDVVDEVIRAQKASASHLQRRFKIGYNRAARLVEEMEEKGIIGPQQGSKPREVLTAKVVA